MGKMCKVHSPIGNTEDITEKPAEITDPANAKAILNVSVFTYVDSENTSINRS